MKTPIYTLLISLFLFSCNGLNSNNNKTTENKDSSATHPVTQTPLIISHHVLLSNIKPHCFSDNAKKDTFKLILTGDSLHTATAIFSIISYKGEKIYADTFHGYDLTQYEDSVPTILQVEAGIKERVQSFFKDTAFCTPAIKSTDEDAGNLCDPDFWNEIATDKTAIGFKYEYGYESNFWIAYSKKQHKVVVYWCCC